MSQSIQPLRIQKGTTFQSPTKSDGLPVQRPLSELGPMERRRNSPSYNQVSKAVFGCDSSPFDSSPLASNSPRLYWQNRDPTSVNRISAENRNPFEQRETSPSPAKRSSLENLKRASRVKNSNMFAREHNQEYDPTSSLIIERPLALGRPLNVQAQNKPFVSKTLIGVRNDVSPDKPQFEIYDPSMSVARGVVVPEPQKSLSRGQTSPAKSSLSRNSRYSQAQAFDPENGTWSEDEESIAERQLPPGKSLHGHSKSVTFDAAPPQINEYEMTTPDPSSVASGSREGSYESTDEDESFDRGSSIDHDDSFDASLEDTDKTPVVLPEDWRFMSPEVANNDLVAHMEDPFVEPESSPAPTVEPKLTITSRPSPTRTDSINSNGERRPLPPLPPLGMPVFPRARSDSNNSLSATAERVSSFQRMLPSPPQPASITKSEIQGMGGCSVPIEDRLRLMMIQDPEMPKSPTEEQRNRRLKGYDARDNSVDAEDHSGRSEITIHEDKVKNENAAEMAECQPPPRISRESILRKIRSQQPKDIGDEYSSPAPDSISEREELGDIDPDTPLPSLEGGSALIDGAEAVVIKQEDDGEVDLYSIPDLYHQTLHGGESQVLSSMGYGAYSQKSSNTSAHEDDDGESHYSTDSPCETRQDPQSNSATEDEGPPTPRAQSSAQVAQPPENKRSHRMSLPQFASMLGDDDFGLGLQSYMTPSPPAVEDPSKSEAPIQTDCVAQYTERPVTPVEQLEPPRFPGYDMDGEEEPRTPDSVIRHSITETSPPDSPEIPEPVATVKAPGAKLKTRPSITPADAQMMAETRRQVSVQQPIVPPAIALDQNHPSPTDDPESFEFNSAGEARLEGDPIKQVKRKSSLIQLEVPVEEYEEGLSFGLDKEFDRVMEAQKVASALSFLPLELLPPVLFSQESIGKEKNNYGVLNNANAVLRSQKGYLMRQNTKVVVASSASNDLAGDHTMAQGATGRGTRSAGNSPRKPSQQTWTTEPWNGKARRKSIRLSGGSPQKKVSSGPAPPLPGQSSNVTSGLDSVTEDQTFPQLEEPEDGGERGRLFVKVVGVKELDLPLPRGERSYFALTLDNGLHCVTTAWLELGKFAPIGQEFELVVLNDLEFQLTLQTKLEEPKPVRKAIESPTKAAKISKPSTFSRVFASPKKRKELEMKQQEEAERAAKQKQAEAQANKRNAQPTAWDLLNKLVAKDGSFARSYICLKDHEAQAYGKPYTVDIPCFNEWATEEVRTLNSLKSNRGLIGTAQRKAPYKIGKLELQLLYVPKPKDAKDEDMPKSMNACIRELQEAELSTEKSWEGHLSQQGGDCPYWRRRFFRLQSSKLTAYHEVTRQPRATINLAKASKLIDDKSALIQKEVSGRGGSRRKSAFAEEEEGYMFVEEGFRVRFANGETIDFYADSAAEKDGWMKVLADVVGKDLKQTKSWTDLVLARERSMAARAAKSTPGQVKPLVSAMRSAPPTPGPRQSSQLAKGVPTAAPPPLEKDPRHMPNSPGKKETRPMTSPEKKDVRHARSSEKSEGRVIGQATRQKTRSMIF